MSNTENKIKLYNKFIEENFKDKNNNILILDSYNNLIIEWLFFNFCTNKESKIYCVNNWNKIINKINFLDINIEIIKENINLTNTKLNKYYNRIKIYDENIMYYQKIDINYEKKNTYNEIFKLYKEKIFFNIVYINTSIDAINLFMNINFIFNLLNENGVIILDNYNLYKNEENLYKVHTAKIGLDTFLHLYTDQINILYYDEQLIIEKKTYFNELFKNISKNDSCDFLYKVDNINNDNLIYDLIISNNKKQFEKKYGFDDKYIEIFNKLHKNLDYTKYLKYDLNFLIMGQHDFNFIYNSLTGNILNDTIKYNYDPYNKFRLLYAITNKNEDNYIYEIICKIKNNNLFFPNKKKISLLNISRYEKLDEYHNSNIEQCLINNFEVSESKYYRIDNILRENSEYVCSFKNIDEICKLSSTINSKIDILNLTIEIKEDESIKKYNYELNYTINFFHTILFSLMIQEKGGCSAMLFFLPLTNRSMQLLWILKKYYKNIYFSCNNYCNITTTGNRLIATDFIGIDNIELEKLKEIGNKMYECNELYFTNKSNKFIDSILKIDESNIKYKKFCESVTKFNLKKIKMIFNNNKLFYDIICYLKDESVLEELKIKLKNLIFTIQVKNLWEWLEKYKVIK